MVSHIFNFYCAMKKSLQSRRGTPTTYGISKTIPGQALKPSELLKRHLAGTLPEIDLSSRYEYHFDEDGKQVAEPLPLELHEVHRLSVALREEEWKRSLEQRKAQADKHKQDIIDAYVKEQEAKGVIFKPKEGDKPNSAEGGTAA